MGQRNTAAPPQCFAVAAGVIRLAAPEGDPIGRPLTPDD